MSRAIALVREAIASTVSQRVASIVTVLMVAGMVVAVMLTTGRTVGAEQNVLGTIDSAGTRSILVRAENDAGVTSRVMDRIERIDGVSRATAFSAAIDSTNSLIPNGNRVPVRFAFGSNLDEFGIPSSSPFPGQEAYASDTALDQLGLTDSVGSIVLSTGAEFSVMGRVVVPDYLSGFEPVVLVPKPNATGGETVNVIVVIAARPDLVTPVSQAIQSVLAPTDRSKVTVQTSDALAQLRALVQGQLGSFSRGLVLAMLAITAILLAAIQFSLVLLRRKDFGRRRALGATRSLIIILLLTQTLLLSVIGVALGSMISVACLVFLGDPLPGTDFYAAIGILTAFTSLIAAFVPALIASTREPIKELRVP